MKPKTSVIWNYFNEVDANSAKCKICEKTYSRKGGTTISFKGHLKSLHATEYEECIKLETEKNNQPSTSTPLQEAKKQMTLKDALMKKQKWDSSNPKSIEIDNLISQMIALQDLPFNFVEGIGFRRLLQFIVPNYQLRGRNFFTSFICDELYPKLASKIVDLLKTFRKMSFTTDIWTEPSSSVSLLSLTAHGITEDFKRIKLILKCHPLNDRHTGDVIQEKFNAMLLEWQITSDKIHCFVRDCGSNMIRAMRLADIPDINCTVHQLQLCVRTMLDSNEEIKKLIAKCKQISTHFNHSQIAQTELKRIQTEQLNQEALGVVQECSTRWNSVFYMLERMIKIKDSLCLYAGKHSIPQISPEEWLYLNKLVTVLQPFEEVTRNMSDSNTSISSVIPLIHILKHTLQLEDSKPDTNKIFKTAIKCIIEQLNSRFGDLPFNNFFAIATYLDPRYKTKFFNEVTKEKIESELMSLFLLGSIDNSAANEAHDNNADTPAEKRARFESSSADESTKVQSILSNILMSSDDDGDENITTDSQPLDKFFIWKSLLNEYNKEKRIPVSNDPLLWWRENKKFKILHSIARQYLSCPPGSVASEQLFSGAGLIYDPLKNRLDGEKAAKLLFIKYNLLLLESIHLV